MKSRYTTIDIKAALAEIQKSEAIGLRVMNVYDIDNKTYLIRLVHGEVKIVLLIESGNRIHLTEYDWPKNMMPSGFSMKCRKHLKGRRLASVSQLGIDRIVDLTFGYDEAAYHFIVELYDRGNIILTDFEYNILQLLRSRTDTDKDVKFAVKEKYPVHLAKQHSGVPSQDRILEILTNAKPGENLKRILNPNFVYGPAVLEHVLLSVGLKPSAKIPQHLDPNDGEVLGKLMDALHNAEHILENIDQLSKGHIIQRCETKGNVKDDDFLTYSEFHPSLYVQHSSSPSIEFSTFNKCVDEFFSKLESQKMDMKAVAMEKGALKRLENVKEDHKKRLEALKSSQDIDTTKAELIEMNLPLVEKAIATINSAIANQIDWEEIEEIVKEAKSQQDSVALAIKTLNLQTNQMVLSLCDVYEETNFEDEFIDCVSNDGSNTKNTKKETKILNVNIDLGQTAFANARSYHTKRRQAASKEEKTIQASKKALKSAEQKTKETLKEVQTAKLINKTRKANWFEKFFWFISSENYLVVGGRDQQQNELLVKRYLKSGDIYVHADLHGASSVIIKNKTSSDEIPPKTLNEAGTMAICYSAAWEARVVTSAWWVHHNQVSKTAPSGEYLTTGSFMIRGKKNYLPPSHLVMGFSVMFKLDESSIANHLADRKVRLLEDEIKVQLEEEDKDEEICIDDDDLDEIPSPPSSESIEQNKIFDEIDVTNHKEIIQKKHQEPSGSIQNEEEKEDSIAVEEEDSSADEVEYPDTSIQLQHVSGDVFQLQRGSSTYSNDSKVDEEQSEKEKDPTRKPKLSKKQRRDLKKQKKENKNDEDFKGSDTIPVPIEKSILDPQVEDEIQEKPLKNTPSVPVSLKRGQKKKLKKMKEKYKDQDEEDRELMKQILQSSGSEKESKKKGKSAKVLKQTGVTKQQQQNRTKKSNLIATDILHEEDAEVTDDKNEKRNADDDEEDEDKLQSLEKDGENLLNSLTGQPRENDILLYVIPVCAPYSSMQLHKYKVKVTPGTGKRGKATKSAIHMFLQAKESTEWEKDLLKSLKDTDNSRNMPGKVKISAPNLQRIKKKK